MATREYQFIVGPETSTLPSLGTPSTDSDLVSLGFLRSLNSTTHAAPLNVTASGITSIANAFINIIYVQGSGGAIDITGSPQIVAGTRNGDIIILRGCSDTNTLRFDDGNGLQLNGFFVMANHTTLALMWNSTSSLWTEIFRSVR